MTEDVYSFDTIFSSAAASAFTTKGLNAFHPLSPPDFQKTRPRVECLFEITSAFNPPFIDVTTIAATGPMNTGRNMGWNGALHVFAITDADTAGKPMHSAYVSYVRNACATLMITMNGSFLVYHRIQRLTETTSKHGIRSQDGYEQTQIDFDLAFTIQFGAWSQLTN
jgi:hypothetical protein